MANIVIQTEDEYRNKGFAKKVVEKIAEQCLKKGLIPTYLVNKNNIPSRRVAGNAGFELLSKEMVVSIDNAND